MRIPEVRAELEELAIEHGIPRLKELADELIRRRRIVPTPAKSKKMTPALKAAIKKYKKDNPDASYKEIADKYDVNIGRVSEAIVGKRK